MIQSVTIEESDLLTKTGLKADILLANLTADIISRLAEAGLTAHIKDGGFMVYSGIINKRKGEVIKALKDEGADPYKRVRGRRLGGAASKL